MITGNLHYKEKQTYRMIKVTTTLQTYDTACKEGCVYTMSTGEVKAESFPKELDYYITSVMSKVKQKTELSAAYLFSMELQCVHQSGSIRTHPPHN